MLGFLHSTPKGGKASRMKMHGAADLPELPVGGYVRDAFVALGMARDGALGWTEIDAYSRLSGAPLDPWEAQTVRAMSIAYLDGNRSGEDPLAKSPMEREE